MMQTATVALRSIYCVTLACFLWPIAASAWIGLMNMGGVLGAILPLLSIAFAALGVWRIFKVATSADTLDSYVYSGLVKVLRVIGIVGMVLSVLYLVAQLGFGAYMSLPDGKPGGGRGDFYIAWLFLALLGGFAQFGLWVFEVSRLFGFERNSRGEN